MLTTLPQLTYIHCICTLNLGTKKSWVLSLIPVHFTANKEEPSPTEFLGNVNSIFQLLTLCCNKSCLLCNMSMSPWREEMYVSKSFICFFSKASWQELPHWAFWFDSKSLYNHSSCSFFISSFLSISCLAIKITLC